MSFWPRDSWHARQPTLAWWSSRPSSPCLSIPSGFSFFARQALKTPLAHEARWPRWSRIPVVALWAHESLWSGGTPHAGGTPWTHWPHLGLHVGERVWGGSFLTALRLLNLVEEGLYVRLRAGGARHARRPGRTRFPRRSGTARVARLTASAGWTPAASGAHCVNFLPGPDCFLWRLVGADWTALAQRDVWLGRTVCDVRAPHTRTPVRVVNTVVHLYSSRCF